MRAKVSILVPNIISFNFGNFFLALNIASNAYLHPLCGALWYNIPIVYLSRLVLGIYVLYIFVFIGFLI